MPTKDTSFEISAQFSDTPSRYTLKQAVLIYQNEQKECAASIHEVDTDAGGSILPGQPVTMAALEALLTALGRGVGGGFIAPEILSAGLDTMIWWCPAARRRRPRSSLRFLWRRGRRRRGRARWRG